MSKNFFYDINNKLNSLFGKTQLNEDANPSVVPDQLDELSKDTLGNYVKKASFDQALTGLAHGREWGGEKGMEKNYEKLVKREKGIDRAVDRLTKEDEKLDELDKDTLGSYHDKSKKARDSIMTNHEYVSDKGKRDLDKRQGGIEAAKRAMDRKDELSNESSMTESTATKHIKSRLRDMAIDCNERGDLSGENSINDVINLLSKKGVSAAYNFAEKIDSYIGKPILYIIQSEMERNEINELSKDTLGNYVKKASRDAGEWHAMKDELRDRLPSQAAYSRKKMEKRHQGVDRAVDRLTKEDQLDELSSDTLKSYAKKAEVDAEKKHREAEGGTSTLDRLHKQVASLKRQTGALKANTKAFVKGDLDERAGPVEKKDWQKSFNPNAKSVPKSTTWGQKLGLEEGDTRDNIESLRDIVTNHSARSLKFDDGTSMKVDVQTADVILKVYEQLNPDNQAKLNRMVNKDKSSFVRIVDFCWTKVAFNEDRLGERAGPVGGRDWQQVWDRKKLEEGVDLDPMIDQLKSAYNSLDTIDPASPTYKKLIKLLDSLDDENLQLLANAGVKFVSVLAKNRVKRRGLTELSKDTLKSYVKKASDDNFNQGRKFHSAKGLGDKEGMRSANRKDWNHHKGIDRALDRITNEESEQIDELSKDTLGSYAKQAKTDMTRQGAKWAQQTGNSEVPFADKVATARKINNRDKGIDRAVDRLVHEEAEQIDEISSKLAGNYYASTTKKHLDKVGMKPNMYDRIEKDMGKNRKVGVDRALDRVTGARKTNEEENQQWEVVRVVSDKYTNREKGEKVIAGPFETKDEAREAARDIDTSSYGEKVQNYVRPVQNKQLDELSPRTLGSYAKKAGLDSKRKALDAATLNAFGDTRDETLSRAAKASHQSTRRQVGLDRAVDRLALGYPGKHDDWKKPNYNNHLEEDVGADEIWLELWDAYKENEDRNNHSENVILIADAVGSDEDKKLARDILKRHHKVGHLEPKVSEVRTKLFNKLWPLFEKEVEMASDNLKGGSTLHENQWEDWSWEDVVAAALSSLRQGSTVSDIIRDLVDDGLLHRNEINKLADILKAQLNESKKPSAGLSKEKKSATVKKAKSGGDIGKKGKSFDKVASKAAKKYGSKEAGEKVAAAAMWKNIHREDVNEAETESFTVKYKKNKTDKKISVAEYDSKEAADKFLASVKAKGGNGIVSKKLSENSNDNLKDDHKVEYKKTGDGGHVVIITKPDGQRVVHSGKDLNRLKKLVKDRYSKDPTPVKMPKIQEDDMDDKINYIKKQK